MAKTILELVADPARLAIVRALSSGEATCPTELAESCGLHVNTVRSHLAALERERVVAREAASTGGRGRPQLRYRLTDAWRLPSSDLGGMAELLAALVLRLDPSPEQLADLGRQWGRSAGSNAAPVEISDLPLRLEPLGVDAIVADSLLELTSCPCARIAPESPELVCRLVHAAVDGLAEASGGRLRVSPAGRDPVRRTCTLEVSERGMRRGSTRTPATRRGA